MGSDVGTGACYLFLSNKIENYINIHINGIAEFIFAIPQKAHKLHHAKKE